MTAVVALVPPIGPVGPAWREHAAREVYARWLREQVRGTGPTVKARLRFYERFREKWPDLEEWFAAPLVERCDLLIGRIVPRNQIKATAQPTGSAIGYLCYLSLVHGVRLDVPFLSSIAVVVHRSSPELATALGIDMSVFDGYCDRLTQLGYGGRSTRAAISWATGRLMLWRGDPDPRNITDSDLERFVNELRAFWDSADAEDLVAATPSRSGQMSTDGRLRQNLSRLFAMHVVLFNSGQVATMPRRGSRRPPDWQDHPTPPGTPPQIAAVVGRWLLMREAATSGTKYGARSFWDATRVFLEWLMATHPEITTLTQLTRKHMEGYLQFLARKPNGHTGNPIVISTRRAYISHLKTFFRETLSWGWADVPRQLLLTPADMPKLPRPLPRFVPRDQLDKLMTAVEQLEDPQQRAALLLLRWSGARREEIARLPVDCLDSYPDGHPRLRIPIGKGYEERLIPLHPQAATALQEVIDQARERAAAARYDKRAARSVRFVFAHRGQRRGEEFLFGRPLLIACTAAGLVDADGKALVTAHRFRHTVGTQLAEGGARLQTIMSILGHKSPAMSMIYSHISDTRVRDEYERVLNEGGVAAGPAAEELLNRDLDDADIDWLRTNFFKTELELGRCVRLPQEGPCECDLYLRCSKFFTTSAHAPRLRARIATEQQLVVDAETRGWGREVERHTAIINRIRELLDALGEPHEVAGEDRPCR